MARQRADSWATGRGADLASIQDWTAEVLREQIGDPGPVALLDFPWHHNAGDSLIYLGEVAYLKRLGYDIRYLTDQLRYDADALRRAVPEGPILMHGGGNFGDRYAGFQEHRAQVAADFPERAIVQLPQTLEYQEPSLAPRTHDALRAHPNYTLLVREELSRKLAADLFPDLRTVFCPDLAFGVGRINPLGSASRSVVWLLREDSEAVPRTFGVDSVDWAVRGRDRLVWKAAEVPTRARRKCPATVPAADAVQPFLYDAVAKANVRSAVRLISSGQVLVTDRLHAAVTGVLLGMPVIAMDNSYGKIRAVYDAYLHRFPSITFAETEAQVSAQLDKLLP